METVDTNPLMSGRLAMPPAISLVETAFAYEVKDGPLLYHAMSLADISYTIALVEEDLIPKNQAGELLSALLELHEISVGNFNFDPVNGDVYSNRENRLRQLAPKASEWFGFGRARRESTTVGYVLVVRSCILELMEVLTRLAKTIVEIASKNLRTLLPDYTYLQRAQPTTLAHYLLSFVYPIQRDVERLYTLFDRFDRLPAGLGSVNGTRLPIDRRRLQCLLAFRELAVHARDAMWMADLAIEAMSVIQIVLTNVDRLTEDLQIWATREYDFIELSDQHSRISVIMPNKKNPYSLSYIRGISRKSIGQLVSVAVSNLTPSGQVDNRLVAYGEVPRSFEAAREVISLLKDVLDGITFKKERMAEALDQTLAATDLAEVLVFEERIGPRTSHKIVGTAVSEAQLRGKTLDMDLLAEAFEKLTGTPMGTQQEVFAQCLDPMEIVAARNGIGGASPESVCLMIQDCEKWIAESVKWVEENCAQRKLAEEKLLERAVILTSKKGAKEK